MAFKQKLFVTLSKLKFLWIRLFIKCFFVRYTNFDLYHLLCDLVNLSELNYHYISNNIIELNCLSELPGKIFDCLVDIGYIPCVLNIMFTLIKRYFIT